MISLLQKKGLKFFHPILKRLARIYLSRPRNYTYQGITIKVLPGVFHPGLFFSTKVFIEYLATINLTNKKVLELGAGSGLISIFCSKQGAQVTASDINTVALEGIQENASLNAANVRVIFSDLFDNLEEMDFNYILINPPYYPRKPKNEEEQAWFCGEDFEYFYKLFKQLKNKHLIDCTILMILSEDCDIEKIKMISSQNQFSFQKILTKRVNSEQNYIFSIIPI